MLNDGQLDLVDYKRIKSIIKIAILLNSIIFTLDRNKTVLFGAAGVMVNVGLRF